MRFPLAMLPVHTGFRRFRWRFWVLCCAVGFGLFLPGCRNFGTPFAKKQDKIDGIKGPNERRLSLFRVAPEDHGVDENGSLKPIAGTAEYLAAEALYKQEDYAAAQAAFKKVGKKFKKSDIREEALFMQAESAFHRKHFSAANDLYAQMLKDYPSSRHLDVISQRLFTIAKAWLAYPELAKINEVQQVNFEDHGAPLPAEAPVNEKKPSVLIPNLSDKSKPLFDPEGNAIAALRGIWLNDPTGPLADDAIMLTASHYARRGNWVEADRHYSMLREEYPQSPHVQTSFVIGSHVKLMSYEGPAYDEKRLADAQVLKETALRLYPGLKDRDRIENELLQIQNARAHRQWDLVQFYEKKRRPNSVAVYCHLLIEEFPDSPFAEKAREKLAQLGPEFQSGRALQKPYNPPTKPLVQLPSIPGITQPKPVAPPELKPTEAEPKERGRGWLGWPRSKPVDATPGGEPGDTTPAESEPASPGKRADSRLEQAGGDANDAPPGRVKYSR